MLVSGATSAVGVGAAAAVALYLLRRWRHASDLRDLRVHWQPPQEPICVPLRNDVNVPVVGLGTAFFVDEQRLPELAYRAVFTGLKIGYRHIDTAYMYGCERQIGHVLAEYMRTGRLIRDELHITTKVGHPPADNYPNARTQYVYDPQLSAYEGALQEFYKSLEDLGVGYVDLLLVHWPGPLPHGPVEYKPSVEASRKKRLEIWRALEHLYQLRLARAIGVSNFSEEHLEHLLPHCVVPPMMNQIEVHPYLGQDELVDYCQQRKIAVTAYCPLGSGSLRVTEDPTIVEIACSHGVSPAAVILAWLVQRGLMVIPKSSNPQRLRENLRAGCLLTLTPAQMRAMGKLSCGKKVCGDPSLIN